MVIVIGLIFLSLTWLSYESFKIENSIMFGDKLSIKIIKSEIKIENEDLKTSSIKI